MSRSDWVTPDFKAIEKAQSAFTREVGEVLLRESDLGASNTLRETRDRMAMAGLGRLGFALGYSSDLKRGKGVHQKSGGGISASGYVFIRSGSPRSRGAIDAYTEGAEIRPRKGRYLWITGDDLPRLVGRGVDRARLTPALYNKMGLDKKIGPLFFRRGRGGTAVLLIRDASLSASGKSGSAKSLKKNGQPRKGQVAVENIVAFIGIPHTSRAARVNVKAIALNEAQKSARRIGRGAFVKVRAG